MPSVRVRRFLYRHRRAVFVAETAALVIGIWTLVGAIIFFVH